MSSRTVLITGANSGVGYAITEVLVSSSDDFHVIMSGRSLEKVQKAKSEIETAVADSRSKLSAIQLDVTNEKSVEQAVKYVEDNFGRLDALLNNAAVGSRDPDIKTRMQLCMDTNVVGPAVVAAAFRPLLFKSGNPYSIFVSSGAGSFARTTDPEIMKGHNLVNEDSYRASKAALNMIAVIEARDFGPKGLKVFAMSPGFVISNLRGTDEASRTGWGKAGDPKVSGLITLGILQGKRDMDVGKLVAEDGVYPW